MKKILTITAMIASLGLASTPAKADGDDIVKVLGAIMIFQQLFDRDDRRHYPNQNGGYYGGNGPVYDDSGRYQRTCNDNLGCAPRDNNRWNEPRKHGYAQGYDTGAVCGQRVEHYQGYSETLHLDCNGNVMYITRHRK